MQPLHEQSNWFYHLHTPHAGVLVLSTSDEQIPRPANDEKGIRELLHVGEGVPRCGRTPASSTDILILYWYAHEQYLVYNKAKFKNPTTEAVFPTPNHPSLPILTRIANIELLN